MTPFLALSQVGPFVSEQGSAHESPAYTHQQAGQLRIPTTLQALAYHRMHSILPGDTGCTGVRRKHTQLSKWALS